MVDGRGRPLILDFGLARLDAQNGPEMTIAGQFVGSMPWASPEQAAGESAKIDIRTDVYSLGVVLFHILTGRFPYAIDRGPRDVLDNILRAEPMRPRGIDPAIPADVEAIVLKCLAKERPRRYQSAGELGEDLRRYLSGWPVAARPPSTLYQVSTFARRNKGLGCGYRGGGGNAPHRSPGICMAGSSCGHPAGCNRGRA
jgi:serine/threonine protein kinase